MRRYVRCCWKMRHQRRRRDFRKKKKKIEKSGKPGLIRCGMFMDHDFNLARPLQNGQNCSSILKKTEVRYAKAIIPATFHINDSRLSQPMDLDRTWMMTMLKFLTADTPCILSVKRTKYFFNTLYLRSNNEFFSVNLKSFFFSQNFDKISATIWNLMRIYLYWE